MKLNITQSCSACGGTGINDNVIPHIDCAICGGDGQIEIYKLNSDSLEAMLDRVREDTANILNGVASTKSIVEGTAIRIVDMQSTCDKILEIVQKIGG